jgi:hypothetical protein
MTETPECHSTDAELRQRIQELVADHHGRCQRRTFQALAEFDQAIVADASATSDPRYRADILASWAEHLAERLRMVRLRRTEAFENASAASGE